MNNNTTAQGTNINAPVQFNNNNILPALEGKSNSEVTAAMWGMSVHSPLIWEISNMNKIYSSKHGLFASVPIICRKDDCTYKDVCMVTPSQRQVGQRCPMEIAAILARYEQWCAHFDIDTSNDVIAAEDLVDATLIKDLVNIEVQILRAENKIALNGDFMADTLLDIDKKCQPYFGKIISPEAEYLMTLQDKKIKILNQLNATRKDKAADKRRESASDEAIKLFQQVKELEAAKRMTSSISDIDFDDNGDVLIIDEVTNDEGKSEINSVIDKKDGE